MKRLYTASLVLLALALVGLGSCGDASLRREIIGYWVGDSTALRTATELADDEVTYHAYDISVEDEQHLTLIMDYTGDSVIDGVTETIRGTSYLVCTYKILGGALYVTAEVEKCRVELKEYFIDGVDYVEDIRRSLEDKDEEEVQRQAQALKESVEEAMQNVFTEYVSDFKDKVVTTNLKVKDGVLTMQDEDMGGLRTYHRR